MAKVEYPLEEVIIVKKKRVEEAEKFVREKEKALEVEEEKLREREKERDEVLKHKDMKLQQLRDEMDHATTSPKIQQMKVYIKVVKERLAQEEKKVEDQKEMVKRAEEELEAAKEQLKQRRQEVDKLELHKKDWWKKMRKEMQILEEREQDEIGTITYLLHQRHKL